MTSLFHLRRLAGLGAAAVLSLGLDGLLSNAVFAQQDGHGIREFTESTTWRVPAGVTHILAEVWGAGGGGGAGTSTLIGASAGGGGGGGGSGAYARASLAVTPGETLTIRVGAAGAGGRIDAGTPQGGGDGGDTLLLREGTELVAVKGGRGGAAPRRSHTRGGTEGAGGIAEPNLTRLLRAGMSGGRGHDGGLSETYSTFGGAGGAPVAGTVKPVGSFGGGGGTGGDDAAAARGSPGGAGSVLITW